MSNPPISPNLEYLLGEIVVDGPEHREEALSHCPSLGWPNGWWAVSDDQFAYVAFFQFETDAWSYRLHLMSLRMNDGAAAERYAPADRARAALAAEMEAKAKHPTPRKRTKPARTKRRQ